MSRCTQRTTLLTALVALPMGLVPSGCNDEHAAQSANPTEVNSASVTTGSEGLPKQTLSDAEIREAVEREMFYDPSISSDGVDVEVADGIVELTGSVKHLLAKARATLIASAVKGVRAIDNRLEVRVVERDDAAVKEAVIGALTMDPTTERFDISVDVEDQVVTLTGTVQSYAEKLWAARAARSVVGVKALENQIKVEYRANRRDAEILEDVKAQLRWDSVINDGLIDAKVDNGYVTLSGVVGTLAEKDRAETSAWVAGVKGVDARQLAVEWWAAENDLRKGKYVVKSDRQIQDAVEDALLFDPRVNSYTVKPSVKDRVVELTGTVSTIAAKHAAEQIARHTVGVTSVKNAIEVDAKTVLDAALETRLKAALGRDAITQADDVDVDVDHGIAKLNGTVQNFAEKSRAEILAQSIPGIRDVKNDLSVLTPVAFVLEVRSMPDYPYVAPWASTISSVPLKTDLEIKNDIEHELEWSPYVNSDHITVHVDNGVATLDGKVATEREREAAEANAYQGGAVSIDDQLELTLG